MCIKSYVRVVGLCLMMVAGTSCGRSGADQASPDNLQDAIKARTAANLLQRDMLKTDSDVLEMMRKTVDKGDAKQTEGDILLTKDHYGDAVQAYAEAARLYKLVLDGRQLREKLAKAQRGVSAARTLAQATAKPEELKEADTLRINAEGYIEAGEIEAALAELDKAQKAYQAAFPGAGGGQATLGQAVAARTAMLAAKEQVIKDASRFVPGGDSGSSPEFPRGGRASGPGGAGQGPRPGSMADLLGRAGDAEKGGADSLEERQYTPACALFIAAENLYRQAGALQAKREQVQASRQSAAEIMKAADAAFKGAARPASFELGKQALGDADKALEADDLEAAKPKLAEAAEAFAQARAEADKTNALADALATWSAALATADTDLLTRQAAPAFAAARAMAQQAQSQAAAGQTDAATALFKDAAQALKAAVGDALTRENSAKAVPVIARLESALTARRKFDAEDVLAELEKLIPNDPRMAGLRARVAAGAAAQAAPPPQGRAPRAGGRRSRSQQGTCHRSWGWSDHAVRFDSPGLVYDGLGPWRQR